MPDQDTTRFCSTCRLDKPLSEFSRSRRKRSGYQNRCKPCDNARRAEYHRNHQDETAARMAVYRQANRPTIAAYQAQHSAKKRAERPEEYRTIIRAAMAVHRALKSGTLVKPAACEQCGQVRPISAAHHDYSKPLDVRWLCYSCHSKWDLAEPKISRS